MSMGRLLTGKWTILSAVGLSVGFCGLSLYGAPPSRKGGVAAGDRSGATATQRAEEAEFRLKARSGSLSSFDYPIAPPVMAYKAETLMAREGIDFYPLASGGVAGVCTINTDCDDCDPCTGNPAGGTSRLDTCTDGVCVSDAVPEGDSGDCSDGDLCNGIETCDAGGACQSGTSPCLGDTVCVQVAGDYTCQASCTEPGDCDDDELLCNGDEVCLGGYCQHTGPVCGQGASCAEPGEGETEVTCGVGRCCTGDATDPTCARETLAACTGSWLAIGEDDVECDVLDEDDAEDFDCPKYASGIAPQGDFLVDIGPAEPGACRTLRQIGDDYEISNSTSV